MHKKLFMDLRLLEFTENTKFEIEISPFSSGVNTILVKVSDFDNKPLYDSNQLK